MEELGSGTIAAQLGFEGGHTWRRYLYGHVTKGVTAVCVVLDDGSAVVAGIYQMTEGTHDLFVAFPAPKSIVGAVQALDADGRVLAEQTRDATTIEDEREIRKRFEPELWAT